MESLSSKPKTLTAVARSVGLSVDAIRSYLAGNSELSAKTARNIEIALDDLNFDASDRMRWEPVRTLGLMLPDIHNPFFSGLAASVERAVHDRGHDLALLPSQNRVDLECRHVERLRRHHLDGLLVVTNNGDDHRLVQALTGLANIVVLNEPVRGALTHVVTSDNQLGGTLAGKCFCRFGHRRFGYIGGPKDLQSAKDRGRGFKQAVLPRLSTRTDLVECYGDYSEAHGYETILRLHEQGRLPRAIFAGSDTIAVGVLRAVNHLNLSIPSDLSIIAIDGAAPNDVYKPAVTTVALSLETIAQKSVDLVFREVAAGGRPVTDRLPVTLIERDSVARPRSTSMLSGPAP